MIGDKLNQVNIGYTIRSIKSKDRVLTTRLSEGIKKRRYVERRFFIEDIAISILKSLDTRALGGFQPSGN
jgi:hypothetical protein